MRFIYANSTNGKNAYCLNADKIHRVVNNGCCVKVYMIGKFFPIKIKFKDLQNAISFIDNIHDTLRIL